MSIQTTLVAGAEAIAAAIREIDPPTAPDAPTPCADFDVRTLVNHAFGTTRAMARLAAKEGLDPDDPWGSRTDAADGDWPHRLADQLEATANAWSAPEAWQGQLDLGGGDQPASTIGEMAFVEVMVHGWDVARAGGRRPVIPDEVGTELLRAVDASAELGRSMGAYGPEVHVDDSAPDFDRALGLTGRDPDWTVAG
ncbi:MAG TPA: TIGR03086 family metal-binding protein [Microlunatus sp.]|nr:TIGR03086 family metal-binding protein [Microlunatus sp.]